MDVNPKDLGSYIETTVIAGGKPVAGDGAIDNVEVVGANVDLRPYSSAKLVIDYKTNLTAAATLKFGVKTRTGADSAACTAAVQAVLQAATTAATGAKIDYHDTVEFDINPDDYSAFFSADITPDMSAANTDHTEWTAHIVGLLKEV